MTATPVSSHAAGTGGKLHGCQPDIHRYNRSAINFQTCCFYPAARASCTYQDRARRSQFTRLSPRSLTRAAAASASDSAAIAAGNSHHRHRRPPPRRRFTQCAAQTTGMFTEPIVALMVALARDCLAPRRELIFQSAFSRRRVRQRRDEAHGTWPEPNHGCKQDLPAVCHRCTLP